VIAYMAPKAYSALGNIEAKCPVCKKWVTAGKAFGGAIIGFPLKNGESWPPGMVFHLCDFRMFDGSRLVLQCNCGVILAEVHVA
jgi:hypothetical protein